MAGMFVESGVLLIVLVSSMVVRCMLVTGMVMIVVVVMMMFHILHINRINTKFKCLQRAGTEQRNDIYLT